MKLHINTNREERRVYPFSDILSIADGARACAAITACPRYAPTPLIALAGVASACRVAEVLYKHEAERFGLG
ncbi:MAG: hypothetical protein ACXWVJ_04315, partial [Caulobacteraceae bacterium]